LCFALFLTLTGTCQTHAADDPKDNPAADALPKGAKLRLGEADLLFGVHPPLVLQPPEYKAFVVPNGIDSVRRYDIITRRPLDKQKDNRFNGMWSGVLSADGKRFLSTDKGLHTVRETATGAEVKQLNVPGRLNAGVLVDGSIASFSADGKLLAQGGSGKGAKGRVVVWDLVKGEVIFETDVPVNGVTRPVLSADGKLVAIRGKGSVSPLPNPDTDPNRMVWVYEVKSGKLIFQGKLAPSGVEITGFAISPDNSVLASSYGNGVIELIDLKTGNPKPAIVGRTEQGVRLAISPDSKILAAVATDGAIQRWHLADGKLIGTTDGLALQVRPQGVVFVDNERVLAWGNVGGCPLAWEAPSGKILTQLPEHTQAIKSIAFATGGKEIITSGLDGRIVRWDASTGKPIGQVTLKPSRSTIGAVSIPKEVVVHISPDGTKAITSSRRVVVNLAPNAEPAPVHDFATVMDLTTGAEEFAVPRGPVYGTSSVLSPDMTKLITFAIPLDKKKPGQCAVWDLTTKQKLLEMETDYLPTGPPKAAISPSGKRLVTAGFRQNPPNMQQALVITGWDLATGKKLAEVEDIKMRAGAHVAAVNDSFAIISSGVRHRVIDYENGRGGDDLESIAGRPEIVDGPVVVSPDGKRIITSGPAEEQGLYAVRIREWPTGRVLHTFTGHRGPITAITLSPDGKTLATGSQDATVLLWDLSDVK
jgi:WD40 repeat protein